MRNWRTKLRIETFLGFFLQFLVRQILQELRDRVDDGEKVGRDGSHGQKLVAEPKWSNEGEDERNGQGFSGKNSIMKFLKSSMFTESIQQINQPTFSCSKINQL